MHPFVLFVLAAAIFHVLLSLLLNASQKWYSRRKLSQTKGCKPGQLERPWDFLGLRKVVTATRAVLSGDVLSYMDIGFANYGDTYTSNFFGNKVTFTCDAANMKQVLVSRWMEYDAARKLRIRMFKIVAPRSIPTLDGQAWKDARHMWRTQFVTLNNMFNIDSQEEHFNKLPALIPPGETIDMQEIIVKIMTDLMMDAMIGHSIACMDEEKPPEKKRLAESLYYIMDRMATIGMLGPGAELLRKTKFLKATAYLHEYMDKVIVERLEAKQKGLLEEKTCVLDGLMEFTTEVVELRDSLLTLMIGSNQTTGSLLSTVVWLLAREPAVFDKLRKSILYNVGYEAPTEKQLKSFTYLNQVLQEALRLYPPLPFNARIANNDTWLNSGGGPDGKEPLLVKQDQVVVFSIWASQRSKKNFGEDALEFKPERWETLKADTTGYLPFLMGPRLCLGQQFAIMESTYIIARLLQKYEKIECRDPGGFRPDFRLSLAHKEGVLVAFTPDKNCA